MADARTVLLTRLIDDAGLFPPARKPMKRALADHRAARLGPYRWMLGRFLCPVSRLPELAASAPDPEWELGAVADGEDWRRDLAAAAAYEGPGRIVAVELRTPAGVPPEMVRDILPRQLQLYFELTDPHGVQAILGLDRAAAKLRCGGLAPEAFPSDQTVAAFVLACVKHGCPFKATAGLHHPFRTHDAHLGVLQHGFINLLVATALALGPTASAAAPRRAEAIIGEPDPAAFALTATELGWRELEVGIETVLRARQLFVAYGSCSFNAPIEDLLSCGILEPTPARA